MLDRVARAAPIVLLWALLLAGLPGPAQVPLASATFAPETHGTVTLRLQDKLDFQASLNGQPPVSVLFDSGSGSLMSRHLAARLGLKLEGHGALTGFGANTVQSQFALADTVALGGLTLHNVHFFVIDPPPGIGQDFAVLGDQLLQQTVVRLDWTAQQLTLIEPAHFRPAPGAQHIDAHAEHNGVLAQASVDGLPGTFGIDTGDTWSLELFTPFVHGHDLVARYRPTFKGYAGRGFGGPDYAFYTRVPTLQLGPYAVHQPITFLLDNAGGAGGGPNAGNIGQRVLQQFTLTFDLAHGALYLDPNANYGRPDIFNRAGLVLDDTETGSALVVRSVFPGSPAADAGILPGSLILAIDGQRTTQPTDTASFGEARGLAAFRQPVGTTLVLQLRRKPMAPGSPTDSTTETVALTLRDVF